MKVYGIEITPAQEQAAVAVMKGTFRFTDVQGALIRAGVPGIIANPRPGVGSHKTVDVAGRAADRLLQKYRQLGTIRDLRGGKGWTQTA